MPRTGLTPAEIKEKALDATIEKMRKVGFEKVRLTDIAKDLGLSHAALYSHFADKAALLNGVSERWLVGIDKAQEALCQKKKDPLLKIHAWFLALHRAKREKVLHDPELYKAFNMASEAAKPFVMRHLETMHRQLRALVTEAIAHGKIRKSDPEFIVRVLFETTAGFHHPKLVAQHLHEKREPLLRQSLEIVLAGINFSK